MTLVWREVHERLARTQAAIESGASRTPAEVRDVLKARARQYAREPAAEHEIVAEVEILEFKLAGENYGIELPFIQEVLPLKSLTPLPGTPPYVLGIINVHGQVYSVIDLKRFFELPRKELSDLNKVIIVQNAGIEFGVLADAIIGVRAIGVKDIQPSLPTLAGIRQKYLKGVTRAQLVLLDAEKLLTDKSLVVNEV